MSVNYLQEAVAAGDTVKLVRFVHLQLGDGNDVGRQEIDKSWAEAIKMDDATLALLYFHLHFHLFRKSGEWIHDGSQ